LLQSPPDGGRSNNTAFSKFMIFLSVSNDSLFQKQRLNLGDLQEKPKENIIQNYYT
jgi:hypothetical protein